MKRVTSGYPRAKRNLPHTLTSFSDKEIASVAKVSAGAVRAARCRGLFSTFEALLIWVNLHRLINERRKFR